MKKYEYKVTSLIVSNFYHIQETLNYYGEQGYKLINTIIRPLPSDDYNIMYFFFMRE